VKLDFVQTAEGLTAVLKDLELLIYLNKIRVGVRILRRATGVENGQEIRHIVYKYFTVAAPSKTQICGRSLAGIVGSNPTGGKDVCFL
jgi:hypothetical protein